MNWFRKHVKSGSRLALLALAIQFALSFGHFHAEIVRAAPILPAGVTDAAVQTPSDHDGDRHVTDCAICAVLSIANSFLSATPPLLELPQPASLLRHTARAEFAHLGPLHTAFRSRAPPLS
jgi:hypothetical protein